MVKSLLWIILCSVATFWQIVVVCVVLMRNLWITCWFLARLLILCGCTCFGCLGLIGSCQVPLQTYFFVGIIGLGNISGIWNLVPSCLMWNIWTKRNQCSFKDTGKSLDQLLELCRWTLFYWSQCWALSDCSTITDFLLSLSIA